MVGNYSPFFITDMTIREATKRVSEFVNEMPIIVEQIGYELSPEIVNMNQEQLSKGITSEGKMIGDKPPYNHPGYFAGHKQHREELGLQTNYIDLKISGTFYNSLTPQFLGPYFKVISTDNESKVNALMHGGKSDGDSICGCISVREGGFGEEILGLTSDNSSMIERKGTTKFIQKFRLKTGF
jgi:hypothetical protein